MKFNVLLVPVEAHTTAHKQSHNNVTMPAASVPVTTGLPSETHLLKSFS